MKGSQAMRSLPRQLTSDDPSKAGEFDATIARRHDSEFFEVNGGDGQILTIAELDEAQRTAEKSAIRATLDRTNWNRKKAAKMLGIDYKALLYKMKKLGV